MKARRHLIAGLLLGLMVGPASGEPPPPPLPPDVQSSLAPLGPGLVLHPIPAAPIEDPASLLHLTPGTWIYQIVAGEHAGKRERVTVEPVDKDDAGAGFRVETGDKDVQILVVTASHEAMKLSQTDLQSERIIVYRPGLVLDPGMKVGESKTIHRKLSTYKLERPDDVEWNGELDYTTRYVGAYRVKVPAGEFDARLLEHHYEMKIGPAKAKYKSFGFYAADVGLVAEASDESVSAVFVYRRSTKSARVLDELP